MRPQMEHIYKQPVWMGLSEAERTRFETDIECPPRPVPVNQACLLHLSLYWCDMEVEAELLRQLVHMGVDFARQKKSAAYCLEDTPNRFQCRSA
jgi:hypothetical protein